MKKQQFDNLCTANTCKDCNKYMIPVWDAFVFKMINLPSVNQIIGKMF